MQCSPRASGVNDVAVGIRSDGETVRDLHARRRERAVHLTERRILSANFGNIVDAESGKRANETVQYGHDGGTPDSLRSQCLFSVYLCRNAH